MMKFTKKTMTDALHYSPEKLGANLTLLMQENKVSVMQLHRNTNVPLTTIKRMMRSTPDTNPTVSSLLPIAEFFDITIDQLLGLVVLNSDNAIGAHIENKTFWVKVPILTWEEVVNWPEIDYNANRTVLTDIEISQSAFALIVEDDWQLFPKGTTLIFDPEKKPKHHNYILVKNVEKNAISFYQLYYYDGLEYLKPPRAEYKTIQFEQNKHVIIGTLAQARIDQD
ncbi:MAG: helix-turn-helix domain-containing protein [Gammaproteobacteria bacterium]